MTASSATSARSTTSRPASRPHALCLHGITANAHVFEPMAELLAGRFDIVCIDQRGHGRAKKPATGYAASDYARDVHDRPTEKTLLIGHSLGARNALVAGARYPEKISAVVAIDFTPYIEREVFDALDARVGAATGLFHLSKKSATTLKAAIRACRTMPSNCAHATASNAATANGARSLPPRRCAKPAPVSGRI